MNRVIHTVELLLSPQIRERMKEIAARHGAGNLEVFGSAARGDLRADSDIDLLPDIVGRTPPWFPGGLTADLETLVGGGLGRW